MDEDIYASVEERIYSTIETGKNIKEELLFILSPILEKLEELENRVDEFE